MATIPHELKQPEETIRILQEDGTITNSNGLPRLTQEQLKRLYYFMVFTRMFDERFLRMQRQGRIAFFVASTGEEAAQIGSVFALEQTDWIFPQYREPGVVLFRGMPLKLIACQIFGKADDLNRGRQMPCHYAYKPGRIFSISSPVATQMPHAVGFAWAGKLKKEKFVTLTYFGDGASSHGDFHASLNLAGLFKMPVIFFCKNNQWAISLPFSRQTASGNIAAKGAAYGVEGVRVDGNDVLAVYSVTKKAVEKARRGEGATLIEAVTYRMGAHSSSDDPRIYSDETELEEWKKKDPLVRYQRYLESQKIWNEPWEEEIRREIAANLSQVIEEVEKLPSPPLSTLFDDVYETLPLPLQEEKESLLEG